MAIIFDRVSAAPLNDRCDSVMVRTRDGIHLSTDIYRCSEDPGPTVLIRLPYDKNGAFSAIPSIAEYFRDHGYHVVTQDVRGKFRSEGVTLAYVHEAADGYDTLDWIVRQGFSNGVVGMWGDSYFGFTQWAAASTGHPALRAISPRVTGTRLGELPVDEPNAISRDVEQSFDRVYLCSYFVGNDDFYWEVDWNSRPYAATIEEFFAAAGSRSTSFDMTFPEPVNPSPFPFGHPFEAHAIPLLQTIGWWDNCSPLQWDDHWTIQRNASWSLNEYLIIDSTDHMGNRLTPGSTAAATEYTREQALPAMLDPTIEFFDVFLRNQAEHHSVPKVRWNLAHTEGFRVSNTWPPPGTHETTLHLTQDGDLRETPEESSSGLRWIHDPEDLVPSPSAESHDFLAEYPDEQAWSDRPDVSAFNGPTLNSDLDLVGSVTFTAECASTGPCMDLFVRLLDVGPNGSAHLIARGQQHLIRDTEGARLVIDMGQVGYRVRSGHRLRLHVASSDFPEFVPQPGTGEHPWLAVSVQRNEQTLIVGGQEGAQLILHALGVAA